VIEVDSVPKKQIKCNLQEAMKIELLEAENQKMFASKLSNAIFERRLYLQKKANKAQHTQIRGRRGHYPGV